MDMARADKRCKGASQAKYGMMIGCGMLVCIAGITLMVHIHSVTWDHGTDQLINMYPTNEGYRVVDMHEQSVHRRAGSHPITAAIHSAPAATA
jgi:hypothetical protein